MPNKINLVGKRFGRLTVMSEVAERIGGSVRWLCKCDCGKTKVIQGNHLRSRAIRSCGCLWNETACNYKHGMRHERFYKIFYGIRQRCFNPNNPRFHQYGGRGIKLIWSSFLDFKQDMYKLYLKHCLLNGISNTTIDRIDVNGNYCKENCKWSTWKEQATNKRKTE